MNQEKELTTKELLRVLTPRPTIEQIKSVRQRAANKPLVMALWIIDLQRQLDEADQRGLKLQETINRLSDLAMGRGNRISELERELDGAWKEAERSVNEFMETKKRYDHVSNMLCHVILERNRANRKRLELKNRLKEAAGMVTATMQEAKVLRGMLFERAEELSLVTSALAEANQEITRLNEFNEAQARKLRVSEGKRTGREHEIAKLDRERRYQSTLKLRERNRNEVLAGQVRELLNQVENLEGALSEERRRRHHAEGALKELSTRVRLWMPQISAAELEQLCVELKVPMADIRRVVEAYQEAMDRASGPYDESSTGPNMERAGG